MPLAVVKDVSFSYGTKRVFDRISFSVAQGEIFCLIGPNGCGKTTLLDCLLGLHAFQSGTFWLSGKDAAQLKPKKIAQTIAYVPQIHERTFPYTVREIVTMGRAAHLGFFQSPSSRDGYLADEALERIGISHLSPRPYTQLSGGEVQLVLVARALAQQAPLIIMDEPTAHLDFRYELIIMEVISDLVKDKGMSVIMATHIPNHAFYFQSQRIQTSIALFNGGKFLDVGDPELVIDKGRLQQLYGINADVIWLTNPNGGRMRHIVPLNTMTKGDMR
jgi:iron complex transport system ATP-binding protein